MADDPPAFERRYFGLNGRCAEVGYVRGVPVQAWPVFRPQHSPLSPSEVMLLRRDLRMHGVLVTDDGMAEDVGFVMGDDGDTDVYGNPVPTVFSSRSLPPFAERRIFWVAWPVGASEQELGSGHASECILSHGPGCPSPSRPCPEGCR